MPFKTGLPSLLQAAAAIHAQGALCPQLVWSVGRRGPEALHQLRDDLSHQHLEVCDIYGRLLKTLAPDRTGCRLWDGSHHTGREVPAGCYLLRASGPDGAAGSRLVKL
jgi:hypothetical protein